MRKRAVAVWGALVLGAVSLMAHHSWGGAYDMKQRVVLKGKVVEVAFKDPHVIYTIETKGSGMWKAESTSPAGLARRGISANTIKVGEVLEIVGSPSREPGKRQVAMVWEVRRPADRARWNVTDPQPGAEVPSPTVIE